MTITLGTGSYICEPKHIHGGLGNIIIGKFCSIAAHTQWDCGFQHDYKNVTTFPMHILKEGVKSNVWVRGDICLHNDIWVGQMATIMGGVTIGNGAVIGANSTVRRNVEPYEIYTGETIAKDNFYGKLKKYRFDYETRQKLLEIAWWDWEESRILANAELLVDRDINNFINNYI